MSLAMRGAESGNFQCAIPGCGRYTLRRSNKLCKLCWREYGKQKPIPEWLRFLINFEEKQRYHVDKGDGLRFVSFEKLLEDGTLHLDTVMLYRGPGASPRKRKKHHSRRGRPAKCVQEDTGISPRQTIISVSR